MIKCKIINKGIGGFLNPPGHPEHYYSVVQKGKGGRNKFSCCLRHAIEDTEIDEQTRKQARELLENYKLPDINSEGIKNWIYRILGYFNSCYAGKDENGNLSWTASDCEIHFDWDAIAKQELHLGVHFIRQWYPRYVLTQEDLDNAFWGDVKIEKTKELKKLSGDKNARDVL